MRFPRIRHRDWLAHSSVERTLKLIRSGKCPRGIEGWLLLVALKHPLRAIYGSDLRAALALLFDALIDKIRLPYDYLCYRRHRSEYEQDELRELCEDVKESILDNTKE